MQSLSTIASHIFPHGIANPKPRIYNTVASTPQQQQHCRSQNVKFSAHRRNSRRFCVTAANPSSVGSDQYVEEPKTNVKFPTSLSLPGCSNSLSLLGTGYREKVFAIIGVKVYAVGFYTNPSISSILLAWKGKSTKEIEQDGSLFNSIFQAPFEKSLWIVLVRDVDGKTFWDALNEAITPRIKTLNSVDEAALSTFRSIFQGRDLKKGTNVFLTWPEPSKMLVAVSSQGLPSVTDATVESKNVTFALFDVFFGNAPVSPSLKSSVVGGLAAVLK